MGVALVQRIVWQHAEQQPRRVPHDLPGIDPLHALGAQLLKSRYLGVQVAGVNVQVHSRGTGPADALASSAR